MGLSMEFLKFNFDHKVFNELLLIVDQIRKAVDMVKKNIGIEENFDKGSCDSANNVQERAETRPAGPPEGMSIKNPFHTGIDKVLLNILGIRSPLDTVNQTVPNSLPHRSSRIHPRFPFFDSLSNLIHDLHDIDRFSIFPILHSILHMSVFPGEDR